MQITYQEVVRSGECLASQKDMEHALLAYVMCIPQYFLSSQVFLEQWQVRILQAVTIHKEINVIFKYFSGM